MQFTVHAVNEETGELVLTGVFKTDNQGYKDFCEKLHAIEAVKVFFFEEGGSRRLTEGVGSLPHI